MDLVAQQVSSWGCAAQAAKPRGVVLFVHGHGAYLLHELLRVDVRVPCALSEPPGLSAAAASREPLGPQAAPAISCSLAGQAS